MSFELECLTGPLKGRRMIVPVAKPLTFAIKRHGEAAGQVQVERVGDQCVVTNRSSLPCLVNDQERVRSTLFDADEVVIGKDRFRVLVTEPDEEEVVTQAIPAPVIEHCAICDAPVAGANGWSDGDRRICRACLSKGAGPQHLAQSAHDEESTAESLPAPAEARVQVSDSDRLRHQRRISASRLSVVASEAKPGLLAKVTSAVFGSKEDRERLERLEHERGELLIEAGRLSLQGGGLGLGARHLRALLSGQAVTIQPQEVDRPVLDNWKAHRERLAFLDAEIAGLRKSLRLKSDSDALLMPPPPSRRDQKDQEERTFATLDGLSTSELVEDLVDGYPPPPPSRPAPANGRQVSAPASAKPGARRTSGRRRR